MKKSPGGAIFYTRTVSGTIIAIIGTVINALQSSKHALPTIPFDHSSADPRQAFAV